MNLTIVLATDDDDRTAEVNSRHVSLQIGLLLTPLYENI
jgi:hypothetical protein